MKRLLFVSFLLAAGFFANAQKVDSIYFHLYTDSLKKGQFNYINVDGKMSDGSWKPLTSKEIIFTSSDCKFSGNELILPGDYQGEKISVKAVLRERPEIWKEVTIWVKKLPDPERLPGREEIFRN